MDFTYKVKEDVSNIFTYELEEKTIEIEISYIPDNKFTEIVSKSKTVKFVDGHRIEELDDLKMKRKILKASLKDIKGAQVIDIIELVEPCIEFDFNKDPNTDLTFEPKLKEFLKGWANYKFATFVYEKCRELNDNLKKQKKEQLENFASGSGTRSAPKSSAKTN
jgi:hypothetical protein